jgi:hypothetical protein
MSSAASASRAWLASGSDMAGFSPMMYMPLDAAGVMACMTSTTVRPGLSSSVPGMQLPGLLEAGFGLRIVDTSGSRVHHRDQAGVRRALHVVLAAQRMQAGAGTADLARHQRQRDQAARIVGAVHVLRHAHAPQDHRALRGRVQARHVAQRLGVDAADRRHQLRAVAARLARSSSKPMVRLDEALVDQAFGDDHVHHRVQHGDVGVGLELQVRCASAPGPDGAGP